MPRSGAASPGCSRLGKTLAFVGVGWGPRRGLDRGVTRSDISLKGTPLCCSEDRWRQRWVRRGKGGQVSGRFKLEQEVHCQVSGCGVREGKGTVPGTWPAQFHPWAAAHPLRQASRRPSPPQAVLSLLAQCTLHSQEPSGRVLSLLVPTECAGRARQPPPLSYCPSVLPEGCNRTLLPGSAPHPTPVPPSPGSPGWCLSSTGHTV